MIMRGDLHPGAAKLRMGFDNRFLQVLQVFSCRGVKR